MESDLDEEIPELVPIQPVPVTIVTGFLGAGKTTIIDYMMMQNAGKKIAVIENEFGAGDIGQEVMVGWDNIEYLELRNGCLCCSVKDKGVKAIENLMKKNGKFDYIFLETTGLADPGPIASMFWLDKELGSDLFLDAIITIIDAKMGLTIIGAEPSKIHTALNEEFNKFNEEYGKFNEAVRQIALADVIVINKMDGVDSGIIEHLEEEIRKINSHSKIVFNRHNFIGCKEILDIRAYSSFSQTELTEKAVAESRRDVHNLKNRVETINFDLPCSLSFDGLKRFLEMICWEKLAQGSNGQKSSILRMKGLVQVNDRKEWVCIQGLYYEFSVEMRNYTPEIIPPSRLVLIGHNLDSNSLLKIFEECLKLENSKADSNSHLQNGVEKLKLKSTGPVKLS